jgi:serine O-acetyltransferase
MNAIGLYRVANWCFRKKIPFVPKVFHAITFLMFNSHIPYTAIIGKKTRFAYGAIGVVIHKDAIIGENCIIGTNVTIGGGSGVGVPVIGDNVYVATGSKIIGNIKIGSNSVIGANAVVVKNIPAKCVAAGVPAKVIHENINVSDYCKISVLQ